MNRLWAQSKVQVERQAIRSRISEIQELAQLALEALVDTDGADSVDLLDLQWDLQARMLELAPAWGISHAFLDGVQQFVDTYFEYITHPRPLGRTDIQDFSNPKELYAHASNAWLKYVTGVWSPTWLDDVHLLTFIFRCYESWILLTQEINPENATMLCAFDAATKATREFHRDLHRQNLLLAVSNDF